MAKAPSLRKDWTKGTQRTRELSTGKALWSWRNGKERFVRARRGTAGAKPYTMKVVRTVFNGGHEERHWFRLMAAPHEQFFWTSRQWRVMLLRRATSLSSGGDYDTDSKAMPLL